MKLSAQACFAVWLLLTLAAAAQQPPASQTPAAPPAAPAASQGSDRPNVHTTAEQGKPAVGGQSQNLPNAPSASTQHREGVEAGGVPPTKPFVPLRPQQKVTRWVHTTYSPYTFLSTALSAGISQAADDWPTYGQGMEGYGKRYGATLADTEAGGFFKVFLLPTLLHQDPRYFRSGFERTPARAGYAVTRVLITRKDDGSNTFNTSEVLGTLFVKSLSNAYYPRRDRGFGDTMSRTASALLSDAGSNMLREFWPDIRRVFRKHEPGSLRKIEERMPKTIGKQIDKAGGGAE